MQVPGRPGVDTFWSHDVEGILLHVLEELCQHLGHLQITRDLVTPGPLAAVSPITLGFPFAASPG